jgi:hypothetical protein
MATSHSSTQELEKLSLKAQLVLHDLSVEVGRLSSNETTMRKALKGWRIESPFEDGTNYVIVPLTPSIMSLLREEDKAQ